MKNRLKATEEQLSYAKVLNLGMKIGLLAIIVTFIIYLSGILPPHVPVNDLPKYWSMPVKTYLKATGIHPGWWWISMLGKGDFLNFIGIAFLAGVTICCCLRIIPIFLRKKDTVYATIVMLEVIVLALAASGILKAGGH